MKYYTTTFRIYRDWITLIPTIDIHINSAEYQCKNFRIEVHWLCFHTRFMWKMFGNTEQVREETGYADKNSTEKQINRPLPR